MRRLSPVVAVLLFAASCAGEHFNRALVEQTDAGQDLANLADAVDVAEGETGADVGPDLRDAAPSEGTSCPPMFGGDLLYVFDTSSNVFAGPAPATSALPPGGTWFAYAEVGGSAGLSNSTTAWNETEGHSCPGAAALTANFTVYAASERVLALVNFGANWAVPKAYARLHAWIKVVVPTSTGTLDHLDQILLITNTNGYNAFQGAPLSASLFADGDWHEIVRELIPGPNYVPAVVNQVGVQIVARSVAPAIPSAPLPTTLYIDDVWLEQ